jgi:hypothetical protein
MCDNLGEDVQDELGNEAPVAGEVHSESGDGGDSSVDAAERTECHLDRSQVRSADAGPSLHALPPTEVGPTKVPRRASSHLSTGDPHVAAPEPHRAASDGLPQDGAGVEEVSPTGCSKAASCDFVSVMFVVT